MFVADESAGLNLSVYSAAFRGVCAYFCKTHGEREGFVRKYFAAAAVETLALLFQGVRVCEQQTCR